MKRFTYLSALLVAAALCACDSDTLDGSPDTGAPGPALDAGAASLDGGSGPWLDDGSIPRDGGAPEGGNGDAALVDAAADATAFADAGAPDAGSACLATLKPRCGYDALETSCSSIVTTEIPLSDGGTAGGMELQLGPYGGYVEWNEGKAFANPRNILEDSCELIASTFGEPPSVTADVLNLRGQDLTLYTVVRPACMKEGEKYPVITWGNGTCGQSGGYGALLVAIASHGFVVVAANSRWTDGGNDEMLKALDFAKAANEDPTSIFYQKLDLDKVGAMGHSQGSSATAHAATDPRIKAVILWNGGSTAAKPFLAVSGDRDIGNPTVASLSDGVKAAAQGGAWLFFHEVLQTGGNFTGHLTLMMEPERAAVPAVAWWKYMLNGDAEARAQFIGTDCGLCSNTVDFDYGSNGKLP